MTKFWLETAKLNGLNPEGYLKFVLEHKIDAADQSLLEKLMPWNVTVEEDYPPPPAEIVDSEDTESPEN